MKRGEHQVSGQGRLDRDLGRLAVADLPDHDHVGIGAHHRAQAGREIESNLGRDLYLSDPVQLVLDGVLDGDDVLLRCVQGHQGGIQGRGLARAGRSSDEHRPVRFVERLLESLALGVGHAELFELHHDGVLVEDPHHDRLAVNARERDHAQVDVATFDGKAHATVLGQAPLGDIQLGHDLHPRDHARGHAPRNCGDVLHDPVDAHPDAHLVPVGRQMHIRGAPLDRLGHDLVDELDDGSVVGGLAKIDDLGLESSASSTALFPETTSSRRAMREIRSPIASGEATATRTS